MRTGEHGSRPRQCSAVTGRPQSARLRVSPAVVHTRQLSASHRRTETVAQASSATKDELQGNLKRWEESGKQGNADSWCVHPLFIAFTQRDVVCSATTAARRTSLDSPVSRCMPSLIFICCRQWTLNWNEIDDKILVGSCPRSTKDVVCYTHPCPHPQHLNGNTNIMRFFVFNNVFCAYCRSGPSEACTCVRQTCYAMNATVLVPRSQRTDM